MNVYEYEYEHEYAHEYPKRAEYSRKQSPKLYRTLNHADIFAAYPERKR